MRVALHSLRLLAVALWLGGLVFFAFVVAPVAFSPEVTVPAGGFRLSGIVVGNSIRALHWIGLVSGVVFAGCVIAMRRRLAKAELVVVAAMLLLTAISQFGVIPRMERDRILAGGDIERAADDNLAKIDFDRLHHDSEQIEGVVLLGGIALVVLMGFESNDKHQQQTS